jgi:hypothetical protein
MNAKEKALELVQRLEARCGDCVEVTRALNLVLCGFAMPRGIHPEELAVLLAGMLPQQVAAGHFSTETPDDALVATELVEQMFGVLRGRCAAVPGAVTGETVAAMLPRGTFGGGSAN